MIHDPGNQIKWIPYFCLSNSVQHILPKLPQQLPNVVTIVLGRDKEKGLASCPHPCLSVSYLCVPSLPSQPQEGPGSPKHWYYLCAPHLCPPLCRNHAHPTKGNRWCTTVHGMTSVSVGRQVMVNNVAGSCYVPRWRMQQRMNKNHEAQILELYHTSFYDRDVLFVNWNQSVVVFHL